MTIFLKITSKEETTNSTYFLNFNKVSGPNSRPYRILFLLENDIFKHFADLFNLSFLAQIFSLSYSKLQRSLTFSNRFKIRL